MKCYFFIIAFSFNLVAVFAQSTNLGNTYIQSENLLISFDKVMYPGFFGISSKIKDTHELNLLNSIDPKSVPDIELLKMQTKIRCVND